MVVVIKMTVIVYDTGLVINRMTQGDFVVNMTMIVLVMRVVDAMIKMLPLLIMLAVKVMMMILVLKVVKLVMVLLLVIMKMVTMTMVSWRIRMLLTITGGDYWPQMATELQR